MGVVAHDAVVSTHAMVLDSPDVFAQPSPSYLRGRNGINEQVPERKPDHTIDLLLLIAILTMMLAILFG